MEARKVIFDGGDAEKKEARRLLDELDKHTGPGNLPKWNIEAVAFLTFAAISTMKDLHAT